MKEAGGLLRKARGKMARKTLASATGFHPSYIAGVESGTKTGSPNFFEKCAAVLQVPPTTFLESPVEEPLVRDGSQFNQFIQAITTTPVIPGSRIQPLEGPPAGYASTQRMPEEYSNASALASGIGRLLFDESSYGMQGFATALWTARSYASQGFVSNVLHQGILLKLLETGCRFTHVWRRGMDKDQPDTRDHNQITTVLEMLRNSIHYSNYDNYSCVLCPHIIIRTIPTDLYMTKHTGLIITFPGWLEAEPEMGVYYPGPSDIASKYRQFLEETTYPVAMYFRTDKAQDFYLKNARAEGSNRSRKVAHRFFTNVLRPIHHFDSTRPWWARTSARQPHRRHFSVEQMARYRRDSVREFEKTIMRNPVQHVASYDTLQRWAATGVRNDIVLLGIDDSARKETKTERIERLRYIQSLYEANSHFQLAIVSDLLFNNFMGAAPRDTGYELQWVVYGDDTVIIELADTRDASRESLSRILITDVASTSIFADRFTDAWSRIPDTDRDRMATKAKLEKLLHIAENSPE